MSSIRIVKKCEDKNQNEKTWTEIQKLLVEYEKSKNISYKKH